MRTEAIFLIEVKCFEMWWPGTELNRRRQPFQGCALPPELPGHFRNPLPGAARTVLFTPIVTGLPTERKQLQYGSVRNAVDYNNRIGFAQRRRNLSKSVSARRL